MQLAKHKSSHSEGLEGVSEFFEVYYRDVDESTASAHPWSALRR